MKKIKPYLSTEKRVLIFLVIMGAIAIAFTIKTWISPNLVESGNSTAPYTVTFDYGYSNRVKEVKWGMDRIDEPFLERYGYTLDGWFYIDRNGKEQMWDFSTDVVQHSITLTAHWSPVTNQIVLNANGGTCSVDHITVCYDQEYQLPIPTRTGYYFTGWYLKDSVNHLFEDGIWQSEQNISLMARWSTVPVGMSVIFGSFEQDNHLENGKEKIEWYVLDYKSEKYLLISKYVLDSRRFHDDPENRNTVWKDSTIREWLNNTFYKNAFTAEERSSIIETYHEDVECNDRIFLLSANELRSLFHTKNIYYGYGTAYALAKGLPIVNDIVQSSGWYLRMGPHGETFATCLDSTFFGGFNDGFGSDGIRPAMWVSEEVLMDIVKTSEKNEPAESRVTKN